MSRSRMSRNVTFQKSEQVSNEVAARIRAVLPEADVVVNAVARASHQESLFDQIRAVATRNNLNVHDISVQDIGGSCTWSSTWNWTSASA